MNHQQKFEAKHAQDKNIIIGVAVALVVLGSLMVWLTGFNSNPGIGATTTPITAVTSTSTDATSTAPASGTSAAIPTDKINQLAQFLGSRGITMYGAEWCTHCQDQKDAFGAAFKYVPYVECPDDTKLCLAKGVTGYPTWLKPDGTKLEGFVELPALAAWAGFRY